MWSRRARRPSPRCRWCDKWNRSPTPAYKPDHRTPPPPVASVYGAGSGRSHSLLDMTRCADPSNTQDHAYRSSPTATPQPLQVWPTRPCLPSLPQTPPAPASRRARACARQGRGTRRRVLKAAARAARVRSRRMRARAREREREKRNRESHGALSRRREATRRSPRRRDAGSRTQGHRRAYAFGWASPPGLGLGIFRPATPCGWPCTPPLRFSVTFPCSWRGLVAATKHSIPSVSSCSLNTAPAGRSRHCFSYPGYARLGKGN
jgi:hypothetical protein